MFQRIIYEEWVMVIVICSFAVVAAIFLIGTIRAFCLPKAKREHLAHLPLADEQAGQPTQPVPPADQPTQPTTPDAPTSPPKMP
jgi:hypothetical protein